jgi:tetratricopeptide (TPR) repeat protein
MQKFHRILQHQDLKPEAAKLGKSISTDLYYSLTSRFPLKMGKTEEITEGVQTSMNLDAAASQPPPVSIPLTADLPPVLAASSGKTTAEILAELNKSPLFMTDLEENDDMAALQALAYEGTPLENGGDFKERGNECFKERKWADAKEFYTKGVLILAAEERKRAKGEVTRNEDGVEDSEGEIAAQRSVLETLYVNRAACHLELANFRSCTLDCAAALRLNPGNVKALYRSSKALLSIGRIPEADDACARGLELDPENAALKSVARAIIAKNEVLGAKARKENERLAKEKRRAMLLKAALRARGIRTRETKQPPEMEDAKLQLVPDPDSPTSSLSFPTVLLYPIHLETDFIKAFNETETLDSHFSYVFPLPWDKEGTYTPAGVECYVETITGGLLKIGRKVPLLKVLSTENVEVVDEVARIFVVPKAKAEGFVKDYKMKKAAERKSTG